MIPLETQRLILRDFVELERAKVHQYASAREVMRYLTFGPNSEKDTIDFSWKDWGCYCSVFEKELLPN